MSWGFEIPGQPLSWNQAYRVGVINRRAYNRASHQVRTIIKTDEAVAYTRLAAAKAAEARPSRWAPSDLVVVEFYYYLGRDIDCDNVMKLVNDGIEAATGVNDKWYLPRAMSKVTGLRPSERRVLVRIEDIGSA